MAITTADGLIAAARQQLPIRKTSSATTVAAQWHTLLDRAGTPGAGTLTVGDTSAGLVPTDATGGYPLMAGFGGNTGYLQVVDFSNTIACRFALKDRLWNAGSFATTPAAPTTYTITTPPSYLARTPDGAGYGCEIWLEINAAVAASAVTVTVTYTNEAGTTGHSTGASGSLASYITGRLVNLPLQAGDKGVQKVESVIVGGTAAATGSFNVIIARPLWEGGRVPVVGAGDVHGLDKTGFPVIYETSALWPIIAADSTASGAPDLLLTVAIG